LIDRAVKGEQVHKMGLYHVRLGVGVDCNL
jgi:hypothetical protein